MSQAGKKGHVTAMIVLAIHDLPRNINSALSLKNAKNKKDKHDVKIFTIDQLREIYRRAQPDTRLYALLALNCGFYYADISDLRNGEIKDNFTRIARSRTKTGESGNWKLWALTAALLKQRQQITGDFALRHSDGTALYDYRLTEDGRLSRTNHIETKFKDLLASLGISGTFRQLRATGASLVRNASDTDTAKLFLANSKESIAEIYYLSDNFTGLDLALAEVEKLLDLKAD